MSTAEFATMQRDLMVFAPVIYWWIIGLVVGGFALAVFVNVLHATRGMMDRFNV